jgi:hypothetical protein
MPTDQSLIKSNLKFLKIDIWIHSILLVFGVLISACFFIFSFFASDIKGLWFSLKSESQFFSISILDLTAIITIIWQTIAWITHHKFQKNHTKKPK